MSLIALALLALSSRVLDAQETTLYSFSGSIGGAGDGSNPYAGLVMDGKGNLYGTTPSGGVYNTIFGGDGTVFELSPVAGGGWTEKVLYSFGVTATDGSDPQAGLVIDSKGNLYGVTVAGGTNGGGMVFELTPASTVPWKEKVLYNFGANSTDGTAPKGSLIFDAKGNLYGTTAAGGADSDGTVFELTAATTVPWTEKILYNFGAVSNDGTGPVAGLVADATGNLYGTTNAGGSSGDGTVFELLIGTELPWKEKILHDFDQNGTDGSNPHAGLIFDAKGNLYGTTWAGGSNASFGGLGTVFELVAGSGGTWTPKVIHSFTGVPDGNYPQGSLVFDATGNLYGTTASGGASFGDVDGIVFELSPAANGNWTESTVYNFGSVSGDGTAPTCNLIFDTLGNLYGTTGGGGTNDAGLGGTVFEIVSVATATPVFTPPGGPYTAAQTVKITDATANSTIYYTIGGGTPTTSSTKYTEPIDVSASETISAIAVAADHPQSGVATASYQIGGTTAAPVLSPGGIFTDAQYISINDAAPNAIIYYTTNGDTPTTSSTQYGGAFFVFSTETVKAMATATGYLESPVASATYIIAAASPPYEQVLYSFSATANDGGVPIGGVVLDAKGNIYGATKFGGPNSVLLAGQTVSGGTAFELSPKTGGGWTEKILYNFGASGDGANPIAGMIFDAKGNLYGTTFQGGSAGGGTVFELSPATSGYWTEKILHSFENFGTGDDGLNPEAGVIFDSKGNLYGTTYSGGSFLSYGTVFELTPAASGPWTETILHSFSYLGQKDGYFPEGGLVIDSKGNLYGTTSDGGSAVDLQGGGTVFELTAATGPNWPEIILQNFGGGDDVIGYEPESGLASDGKGNLYGTNYSGGPGGFGLDGSIFALSPPNGAHVVDTFGGNGLGGFNPSGTPMFDAQGNLWGTTLDSGSGGDGTVYEWIPGSGAVTIWYFGLNGKDGGKPYAGLVSDAAGNHYGTTAYGGTHDTSASGILGGTVFEIVTTKTAAAPAFSPAGGVVAAGQKITITDATPGATIYYTTNGESPLTSTSPIEYTGAITVDEAETIQAIAAAPGDNLSAVASARYTIGTPAVSATLTPASLTFAAAAVGSTSTAQTLTLKSTGTAALDLTTGGITITGAGAASFLKTTTCGATLAAGASCTISVSFKPGSSGTLTAKLSVADNAATSPQTVTLTGTGLPPAAITLSPTALTYGDIALGGTSDAQPITVSNTGTGSVTLTSITLAGADPTSFIEENNCGATLASGANCTVLVAFRPKSAAALTATLKVTDSAPNSPQTVTLSGTGTALPTLTLSPTSLAFASTAEGQASEMKAVTLTNAGASTIDLAAIALTGTNATSFAQLNTCTTTLVPAASCVVYVVFTPTATGTLTGSLTITDSAAGSPQSVKLTGAGAP